MFFCDEDYLRYLELIRQWRGVEDVEILTYCLMPNTCMSSLFLGSQTRPRAGWDGRAEFPALARGEFCFVLGRAVPNAASLWPESEHTRSRTRYIQKASTRSPR